jgi:hypothetical protein
MSKLYALVGLALIVGYLAVETRGMIFSRTDTKPSRYDGSGGGGGGGGGAVFWGSGYRGGK